MNLDVKRHSEHVWTAQPIQSAEKDLGISRPPIFGMTFCAPNLDGSAAFFSQEILGDSPPKMGCISTLPSSAYQGRAVEVSQSRPSRDDEKHAAGGVLPWGVVFGSCISLGGYV